LRDDIDLVPLKRASSDLLKIQDSVSAHCIHETVKLLPLVLTAIFQVNLG